MKLNSTKVKVLILAILALLLSIRGDGYFPFSTSINPDLMMWISTLSVILVFFFFLSFSFSDKVANSNFGLRILRRAQDRFSNLVSRITHNVQRITSLLLISYFFVNIVLTFIIFKKNNDAFPDLYHWDAKAALAICIIAGAIAAFALLSRKRLVSIAAIIMSSTLVSAIAILYFPITAKVADLMPIVQKQAESFLHGDTIYQYYLLDDGAKTQAVRQPGTSVLFSPAVALGIDIRWMSVIYTALACIFIIKLKYSHLKDIKFDSEFLLTLFAISVFLFFPYRVSRLDLYEPPFWFLFVASLYYLKKVVETSKKFPVVIFIILWGLGIFTQVWFWLFTPFVALFLWKNIGFIKAFLISAAAVILGVGLMAPFVLYNYKAYDLNAFGFYRKTIADKFYFPNLYYLTPLFHRYGFSSLLSQVQYLTTAITGFVSIRFMKSFKSLVFFLGLAFLVFIQFNALTWNYFYINLVLIMCVMLVI